MVINPEIFMPITEFTRRVDHLIEQVKSGERVANVQEILIPGETEMRARARSLQEGVPLLTATYRALQKYRKAAGLEADFVTL
jgi:LDH2 family malate/lactate/ureidoglycolate dehydrogenase